MFILNIIFLVKVNIPFVIHIGQTHSHSSFLEAAVFLCKLFVAYNVLQYFTDRKHCVSYLPQDSVIIYIFK